MAFDYFLSFTQQEKLALLRGLETAVMTGQVTRVKTGRDLETQFNPNVDNSLTLQRLRDSIANSPDFNADDPIQAACRANTRPGITRPNFNC